MYELSYLPVALHDLEEIVSYICDKLNAPQTAADLLDVFDQSLLLLREFPYAHPLYRPIRPLTEEYRLIPVRNFGIFYVVREPHQVIEVHRVLYEKMNSRNSLD